MKGVIKGRDNGSVSRNLPRVAMCYIGRVCQWAGLPERWKWLKGVSEAMPEATSTARNSSPILRQMSVRRRSGAVRLTERSGGSGTARAQAKNSRLPTLESGAVAELDPAATAAKEPLDVSVRSQRASARAVATSKLTSAPPRVGNDRNLLVKRVMMVLRLLNIM